VAGFSSGKISAAFTNETGPLWGEGACMGGGQRKRRLILAIQPRLNPTPYDISEQRRTQVNILGDVMPECYGIADSRRFYEGRDLNGIRTRFQDSLIRANTAQTFGNQRVNCIW
jgi:hypothetical protein